MDWSLDNLTPDEERAIEQNDGYVGVFLRVFVPRLLATAPPKTDDAMPPPSPSINTYIPLAHRK